MLSFLRRVAKHRLHEYASELVGIQGVLDIEVAQVDLVLAIM